MISCPLGAVIKVDFDRPIETAAIGTCDKIFANVTQLGNEAACNWHSDSTLTITVGKGDDLIKPSKTNASTDSYRH